MFPPMYFCERNTVLVTVVGVHVRVSGFGLGVVVVKARRQQRPGEDVLRGKGGGGIVMPSEPRSRVDVWWCRKKYERPWDYHEVWIRCEELRERSTESPGPARHTHKHTPVGKCHV